MERAKLFRLLLFMLAAAVYAWAFAVCRGTESPVYLALEEGVARQKAEEVFAQEEDPVGFCFWGEEAGQAVSCPATGRTARVTRVYLGGNAELLGAGALFWQDGCLIDERTAQDLFGTGACGGQEILLDGQSYPVLGTVSTLRPALIMRARLADPMNRCVLALPAENGKLLGEQFLLRFGLRGKVLDFYPIWALARNLLLLAPMVLLVSIYNNVGAGNARPQTEDLCPCEPVPGAARQSHKLSGNSMGSFAMLRMTCFYRGRPEKSCHCAPVRRLVRQSHRLFLKLLILALGLFILWKGTMIPPEIVPSRWSDFSFWGRWWDAQKENLRYILFTPLGGRQLQILLNMVKSMIGSILAALLVHQSHL